VNWLTIFAQKARGVFLIRPDLADCASVTQICGRVGMLFFRGLKVFPRLFINEGGRCGVQVPVSHSLIAYEPQEQGPTEKARDRS